jgi:HEAT repeat protein
MKRLLCSTILVLLSLMMLGVFTGCGGSKAKVDLTAQLNALKGTDANAKEDALSAIATMGKDAAPAVPQLIPLLSDSDPVVRRLAAYALGEIGAPAATPALPELRKLINDTERSVVTSALNACRAIDPNGPEAKMVMPNVMTPAQ